MLPSREGLAAVLAGLIEGAEVGDWIGVGYCVVCELKVAFGASP